MCVSKRADRNWKERRQGCENVYVSVLCVIIIGSAAGEGMRACWRRGRNDRGAERGKGMRQGCENVQGVSMGMVEGDYKP